MYCWSLFAKLSFWGVGAKFKRSFVYMFLRDSSLVLEAIFSSFRCVHSFISFTLLLVSGLFCFVFCSSLEVKQGGQLRCSLLIKEFSHKFPLSTAFLASHVLLGCDFVFVHLIFISLVISLICLLCMQFNFHIFVNFSVFFLIFLSSYIVVREGTLCDSDLFKLH